MASDHPRRPYMRSWQDEDLRNLWDHVMLLSLLWGHVDTPMKVPQEGFMKCMENFTHLMQEVSTRGLALSYFAHDSVRLGRSIDGLPYGPVVASWLRGVVGCVRATEWLNSMSGEFGGQAAQPRHLPASPGDVLASFHPKRTIGALVGRRRLVANGGQGPRLRLHALRSASRGNPHISLSLPLPAPALAVSVDPPLACLTNPLGGHTGA